MKNKIITIVFSFLCFGCSYGQIESKRIFKDSSLTINGSLSIDNFHVNNDTVKVIIMVVDTCDKQANYLSKSGWRHGIIYWQYGYEVYKFVERHWEQGDYQVEGGYQLIQRLDSDKKPLPKSVIVWQTIKL